MLDEMKILREALKALGATRITIKDDMTFMVEPEGLDVSGLHQAEVSARDAMFSRLKEQARAAIIVCANDITAPIMGKYPQAEIAGWDKREAEARTIVEATDKAAAIAATNIIKALALASGEDTAATVIRAEAVIAKAEDFSAISAAVELMRDEALTTIEAVTDIADMPATLEALKAKAQALAEQYGLG